jgi:hypothetical protein
MRYFSRFSWSLAAPDSGSRASREPFATWLFAVTDIKIRQLEVYTSEGMK